MLFSLVRAKIGARARIDGDDASGGVRVRVRRLLLLGMIYSIKIISRRGRLLFIIFLKLRDSQVVKLLSYSLGIHD